ncbi:MAG TPA: HAD family hydrolase [Opitutaceae bacterium]|nr:HAD family hydrolase [Opitutaceae bacterium]
MSSVTASVAHPFLFLDRDGTLIVEKHFLADPAGVELCTGAAEGLKRLQSVGYRFVMISNQSGIARGILTEEQVRAVNARMVALLAAHGIALAGIYWCPHGPANQCACRKPAPGMIHRAVSELGGDLRGAWVIGDRDADLNLARGLGLPSLLVRTGYGCETELRLLERPTGVVDNLDAAADFILSRSA